MKEVSSNSQNSDSLFFDTDVELWNFTENHEETCHGKGTFKMFLDSLNIVILNYSFSPIMGNKEGNVEYLFYLKHNEKSVNVNFNELVKKSYEVLKVK